LTTGVDRLRQLQTILEGATWLAEPFKADANRERQEVGSAAILTMIAIRLLTVNFSSMKANKAGKMVGLGREDRHG
jgi:hypothetical protein